MKKDILHGTIYCKETSQSAIIFNKELILTSGSLLYKNETKTDIINQKGTFKIAYKSKSSDVNLVEKDVQIFRILQSESVKRSLKLLFSYYKKNINGSFEDVHNLIDYLSKFVLLTFTNQQNKNVESLISLKEEHKVNIQDEIYTKTTPFGLKYLENSINHGIISNTFGDNKCLLHLSCPLVLGCEGGGVFDKKSNALLGMVIFSSLKGTDENIYFTLAVDLMEIFNEFADQMPNNIISESKYSKHAVMLECTNTWGSGCLVKIRHRKFILTCSHIMQDNTEATCYWKNGSFQAKVIYKTPMSHTPYDIAILDIPKNGDIPFETYFCQLSETFPKIGQKLFAVGFPIAKVLGIKDFRPSVLDGRVTKYEMGILFTDCSIQSGQSGCGIFDETGYLIGIAISNFRRTDNDAVYPNSNQCIPVCDIYGILDSYVKSNDERVLEQLIADKKIKNRWQLKLNSKL